MLIIDSAQFLNMQSRPKMLFSTSGFQLPDWKNAHNVSTVTVTTKVYIWTVYKKSIY
jgi:hypothetical protein